MRIRGKKSLILALIFLLLFSASGLALDFLYPVKMERVIDGDTIVVDLCLGLNVILDDQYIRFYGIDAWETRGEEREKGLEAKEYKAGMEQEQDWQRQLWKMAWHNIYRWSKY